MSLTKQIMSLTKQIIKMQLHELYFYEITFQEYILKK